MSEELQRVHDKINYETNVVDPKTFAILLEAVRKNQPLSYEKGRDKVFPNARASAGMQWNPKKVDTHASGTLEQYCLVNASEDRTITVSDLGYKFLSCFDENYNVKVKPNYYKTILLEMLFSWIELEHGRNIHPGRMLFKLMLDPDLEGYHTNNEFAMWTSDECAMTDSDYDKIKQLILEYRANPREVKQKKAEVFLRPFANSWDLFNRTIDGDIYTFTIKEDVLPLVNQFFVYVKENEKYDDYIEEDEKYNYLNNNKGSEIDESHRIRGGTNTLLYGVPGAGKSYTIEHEYCDDENRIERLVFHPDYTYSDFVGQILPDVSEGGVVSYKFTAGPLTRLLKKAYENPCEEYYLIIEEINRGNAPAIFGEVFQLLDRDQIGTSEYGISNSDIARVVYGDESRKIRIPSNLSIIGTMNTADQNVFTLDTAFQRRWNMRMIENDMCKVDQEFANHKILDTDVSWKKFNEMINNIILRKNVRMASSEDKRLGAYFVRKSDLKYNAEEKNMQLPEKVRLKAARENSRFPEKVLKYLWDDAFKFSREDIFETSQYISLEDIVKKFKTSEGNERFTIFKEEVFSALISENKESDEV